MSQPLSSDSSATGPTRTEELIAGGERELFVRTWHPAQPARAVVAIVPGFSSHSGHYLWPAEQLTQRGYAVYAVDLRGRGKSSGTRFHVEKFDDYLADVDTMMALVGARDPGLPVFLLGHSAGGVVATAYALAHQRELSGLVCESYALAVPAPDAVLGFVRWISRYLPKLRVLKLPNKEFSRRPEVVAALEADPLIAGESQTALTVAQMLEGIDRLKRGFGNLTLPVLIMHGSADKVTLPKGSQLFYADAGAADKTLKIYEGHYHDLLSDLQHEIPMEDIARWLEAHLPGAS
ncbi:MAG TPA: alpha/beta hydrolase [Stenotrophomonas sp.]